MDFVVSVRDLNGNVLESVSNVDFITAIENIERLLSNYDANHVCTIGKMWATPA